jgi:hypothetical protein
MDTERVVYRSLLRFADEVKRCFAFLEVRGFRCTRSEATLVRFESAELAINIYHGRQSYEIGLQIENMRGSDSYSFSEFLRLIHNERTEQYRNYASHTVEGVAEGVKQLAELFLECYDAGLLNGSELFSRLKLQREAWARNYALETQLKQARKKAKSAWAEKDFCQVVRVLSPFQEHLSPSEIKMLEYAKKNSNPST